MRTLADKYLGGSSVEESAYKVDLAVLERYQSFSSELLRLSLLVLAGYGFLLSSVVFKVEEGGRYIFLSRFIAGQAVLASGAIALGVCAAAALGHRYFSTDCLAHFVRRIRLSKSLNEESANVDRVVVESIIRHEEQSLDGDLSKCKWLLIVCCFSLVIGVACIAWVFAVTLFN